MSDEGGVVTLIFYKLQKDWWKEPVSFLWTYNASRQLSPPRLMLAVPQYRSRRRSDEQIYSRGAGDWHRCWEEW